MSQKIIVVGQPSVARTLAEELQKHGAQVVTAESLAGARKTAEEFVPNQIIFFLPGRADDVALFSDEFYRHPKFVGTKVVYIGEDVIEGADKQMLADHQVKTLTLGPLPTSEMVRSILR